MEYINEKPVSDNDDKMCYLLNVPEYLFIKDTPVILNPDELIVAATRTRQKIMLVSREQLALDNVYVAFVLKGELEEQFWQQNYETLEAFLWHCWHEHEKGVTNIYD